MKAAILLLAAFASAGLAQVPASPDRHDQVDKIFAKWDSTISPGCALSVIKDGRIVYERG
ncbi:MAG TPA: hypothetical protein VMI94_23100 [Bryobacteraceae bacterium]|nr:hypothetical protein [Bryobacteraceae bacterium]